MGTRGGVRRPAELGEECLNGCCRRSDGVPVRCERPALLCDHCSDRLEGWLRVIPSLWRNLGMLVARGSSLDGSPGGKATKAAYAPMPIRTDVVSLLDHRGDESVIWRLNRWTVWLLDSRGMTGQRPGWDEPTVRPLLRNLPWMLAQPEARGFYRDVQAMHRQMRWALGERPDSAVGTCGAQLEDGSVCGGPLVPLRHSVGVACQWCGDEWQEADLRGLGHLLERRWVSLSVAAYVSQRPEATVRDWQTSGALPSLCSLSTRQVQVDALALEVLATQRQTRRRRSA